MRGRAFLKGVKAYGLFLIRTVLFPLLWVWAFSLARKHRDTDPNGARKVGTAIVLGIVLAASVFALLASFQADSKAGMYDALDVRLTKNVGESEYQVQESAIVAADGQIVVLEAKLEEAKALAANETALASKAAASGDSEKAATHEARASNHEANAIVFQASIEDVQQARTDALLLRSQLEPNHLLYLALKPVVAAQDDAGAKRLIATASFEYENMDAGSARSFEIKDKALADMNTVMVGLLYPGIMGVFFAPLAFATGSILRNAWEPSETVGFKPYPGKALGLFLLMGAFGFPSLLFAAWGFLDMQMRSETGQISL